MKTEMNSNSGVRWTELTGFQRDMVFEIYQLDRPKGLEVKQALEHTLGEKVNHGRLYPNLDELVSHGLVEKGEIDQRSNYYEITPTGTELIESMAQVFASATSRASGGDDEPC